MEPNYIKSHKSVVKSKIYSSALEDSPVDKRKALYGENNQADYLINAKQ